MKYIGLIKWFDIEKGFGKIGTPDDEEVFIHQSNLVVCPDKIARATSLIFEIQIGKRGAFAININFPTSYEDFELILSYHKNSPLINIEVIEILNSGSRGTIKKKLVKSYSLFEYSINQLLSSKNSNNIYDYFTRYFNEHYSKENIEFVTNYLSFTKEKIKELTFELSSSILEEFESENTKLVEIKKITNRRLVNNPIKKFLVQKLFKYYLSKLDNELLFKVWIDRENFFYLKSYDFNNDILIEDIYFEIPSEVFLKNQSKIKYADLNRILLQPKGVEIVFDLLMIRISKLEIISFETIEMFKTFIKIINNKSYALDYETIIDKFNSSISDLSKLILWRETTYFEPDKTFFLNNFHQLTYYDFIHATNEFHMEYFSNQLDEIGEFDTVENFCLLTFLVVEMPFKTISSIFPKLNETYQAAYWLNFTKGYDDYELYYEEYYEPSDIQFNHTDLVSYLQGVNSLNDLLFASRLIRLIQEKYKSKVSGGFNKNDFLKISKGFNKNDFFKISKVERKEIINEIIPLASDFSAIKIVDFFKMIFLKSLNENSVSICKVFIPKFINKDILSLKELIDIIRNAEIEIKYRQEIFLYVSKRVSKYERVSFWLKSYITKVEFNEVIEVFQEFPLNEQPYLFCKLFNLIQKDKITPIENYLFQLTTLSTKPNLNLDVKICLSVICELKDNHKYIGENIFSEIICQYVKEDVNKLTQINELFQKCSGRMWMTLEDNIQKNWLLNIEGKNFTVEKDVINLNYEKFYFDKKSKTIDIEGESYAFKWISNENKFFSKLYEIPIGITFCDAVKSQKDEILNRDFYWCCNSKCFTPCQTDQIHLEWKKYTLRDFIKILKIPFEEDHYYRFVSTVNRANRLMKKLICNSCNHLLRDAQTSEFAFYRVTLFHCTNLGCSEHHKLVYLNHCLNWKCLNIVDNRISKRCPNGLVICDSCSDCCSNKMLESRLNNLKTNGVFNLNNTKHIKLQYLVDNQLGHLERNEKFNYLTGK